MTQGGRAADFSWPPRRRMHVCAVCEDSPHAGRRHVARGKSGNKQEAGIKKASPSGWLFCRHKLISAWLLPSSAQQPAQQRQQAWQHQQPGQREQPEQLQEPEREPGPGPERPGREPERLREPERACCKRSRTEREGQQRGESVSFFSISFIDKEQCKRSFG